MELRHLRYFIAVAEEQHITRAAARLKIQQPPLTRQIKAIERELGVQLLRRKPRGVELTDGGRAFLQGARVVLDHLDRTCESARRAARGEQGQIRVGMTPTNGYHPFVPRVIRAFRDALPKVSVLLEVHLNTELIERLENEMIDVAFVRNPREGLQITPLLEEKLVVALPVGHALAQAGRSDGAPVAIKALAKETFITYGRQDALGLYAATIAACRSAGFNPRIVEQAPDLVSTLNLIAIGLGISLVPGSLQRIQIEGVAYRQLKGSDQPKSQLSLVHRSGDTSAVVRQFVTMVKREGKRSIAGA